MTKQDDESKMSTLDVLMVILILVTLSGVAILGVLAAVGNVRF